MTYSVAAAWSAAAYLALRWVISMSVVLRPSAATDLVHLGACEALVFVLLVFFILRKHAPERSLSQALALRATQPWLIVVGLSLGLCLRIPADFVRQLVERFAPTSDEALLAQSALLRHESVGDVVILLLVVAIVGPLVEELFYRGALFAPLARSRGLSGAAILTTTAFVLAHGQWRDWSALLLVAVVMSYLRVASGSLLPSLAVHVGFNTLAVVALVSGVASATEPVLMPLPIVLGGFVLVGLLMFAVHRISCDSELALHARKEDLE